MHTEKKINEGLTKSQRVEVDIESDRAVIRLLSFVDGLGWCSQKTIRLDLEQLNDLDNQIKDAKSVLERNKQSVLEIGKNVIAFPAV
ncbi:MAG: hypothetical protein HKN33_04505 [Pyrinomonadaceae bacterium]|nr:hypothetical protein [Pyrinomonadaceae bacterium]